MFTLTRYVLMTTAGLFVRRFPSISLELSPFDADRFRTPAEAGQARDSLRNEISVSDNAMAFNGVAVTQITLIIGTPSQAVYDAMNKSD